MIRTILHLVHLNLKTQMAYRFQFWFLLLVKALSYLSSYLLIWLLLARFQGIGTWSIPEVMVLWALAQLSYTLAAPFFFHSVGKLDQHIIQGTYENLAVQPLPPIVNIVERHFSWTYSSQTALNAAILIFALGQTGFEPTLIKLLYLGLTIVGGVGYQAFTFLLGGAMSFRWLNAASGLSNRLRWFGTNLTQYPLSIYPGALRWFLTFIIPAALLNYYPTLYLVDRPREIVTDALLWIAPVILIVIGAGGFFLYRSGERAYQGSGG